MKAAVCRGFGKPLEIEDVLLAAPGKEEVRVRLGASSICHSDISYIDGIWGGNLPAVYGHEGAGEIIECGSGVGGFAVGDRVIVTLLKHCSDCRYCDDGQEALCGGEKIAVGGPCLTDCDGAPLEKGMHCGAFAEEVVVHQSQLAKMPGDMPYEVGALIACGVITGYGAVKNASSLKTGQTAVIIGCGGVGLNSLQAARLAGASNIIAMDLEAEKLEVAKRFGATHGIDPRDGDAVDQVMRITEGRGADCVFVTVGAKAAIDSAQNFVRKAGEVVIVGMPANETRGDYDPGTLTAWAQKIIGTKMGNAIISRDIPQLIELHASGEYLLELLISGRFRLEDINVALDGVRSGKAVKNVIIFE